MSKTLTANSFEAYVNGQKVQGIGGVEIINEIDRQDAKEFEDAAKSFKELREAFFSNFVYINIIEADTLVEKLPESVNKLIKKLGAKVYGYREARSLGHGDYTMTYAKGYYDPRKDIICVSDDMEGVELLEAVLHELIHWTGHKSRLNRGLENGYHMFNSAFVHTEEGIAELGMVGLAQLLKLDNQTFFTQAFFNYMKGYPFAIEGDVLTDAQRAIDYIEAILNRVSKPKVKSVKQKYNFTDLLVNTGRLAAFKSYSKNRRNNGSRHFR